MVALYSGQSGQNGHFPGRAKIFFQIASVPTVIFARYLPSFCFAILLPLSSICFIIGGKRFLISRSFSFVPHGCSRAEFLCRLSHPTAGLSTSYKKKPINIPVTLTLYAPAHHHDKKQVFLTQKVLTL